VKVGGRKETALRRADAVGKLAGLGALTLLLTVWVPVPPAAAGTKYDACAKLTAAEVEAVLQAKVSRTVEEDVVIHEGSYRGETQSYCHWLMSGAPPVGVTLAIIRAPRTSQERDEGLARLRGAVDVAKQQGWTIESASTGGASCARGVPPASLATARGFTSCFMESKGLAFSITVQGSANVSIQQVAGLAGKVASRLP
jgi:hypothetical protein